MNSVSLVVNGKINILLRQYNETNVVARYIPSAVCAAIHEDEQVMLETCRGP
jgi:uncharacterized SAM-dependent methyltransferase